VSTTVIPFVGPGKLSSAAVRPRHAPPTTVLWDALSLWLARVRQRDALVDLAEDKHLLADIGLTREQALREAGKPFWC
jgi:uncharacterized protein YjiS (DUF1127 family)